jgi:hypothetical protein
VKIVQSFLLVLCLALVANVRADLTWKMLADAVVVEDNGKEILRYQFRPPAGSKLAVESGDYFHPVRTPKGVVVTDVAPDDHPHHRGMFLAFVEVHGKKDGDFWGWGQYAPKKDRRIANWGVRPFKDPSYFATESDWMAEDQAVLHEECLVSVHRDGDANVIDLRYSLQAEQVTTLSKWAFGGFCVRMPKEKKPFATGPDGKVNLPLPNHMKPETDWPDAKWYDYTFADKSAGVAVINAKSNPKTLWHNQSAIGMLNPCITAAGEVKLKPEEPLVLTYRVVVHDGAVSKEQMEKLAKDF